MRVVKPLSISSTLVTQPLIVHDPDPTFYFGTEALPQTPNYTYLDISLKKKNLSFDPILLN